MALGARGKCLILLCALPLPTAGAQTSFGPAWSSYGIPGHVVTPSAAASPTGWMVVGGNTVPDLDSYWKGRGAGAGQQVNLFVGFGLFSRLTVSTRVSDHRPKEPLAADTIWGVEGPNVGPNRAIDLAANVSLLLLSERGLRPAIAVGAQDIVGTQGLAANFAVATKTVAPATRLSVGIGDGPAALHGLFYGLTTSPQPWLGLRAEWSGQRAAAGVSLSPQLPTAIGRVVRAPQLESYWIDGGGWHLSASLMLPWDGAYIPPRARDQAPAKRQVMVPPRWATAQELTAQLTAAGFEDVRVATDEQTVYVAYDDRVHLRARGDGLARVLALVAGDAGPVHRRAEVYVLASGRPVLSASVPAGRSGDAVHDVNRGASGTVRYAYTDRLPSILAKGQRPANSRRRVAADLSLRPLLGTHVAWERGLADARVGVIPTLEFPLTRGLHATVSFSIPVAQSDGIEVTMGRLPNPGLSRSLLSHVWNRALTPTRELATHISIGHFGGGRAGLRGEGALMLAGGLVRLDADISRTRDVVEIGVHPLGQPHVSEAIVSALVGVRVVVPRADTRIGVTAGRYYWGDDGATATLSRMFGDTDVSLGIRHTSQGRIGTFAVTLPLVPQALRPPSRVRLRGPASWTYEQAIRLERDGFVSFTTGERFPANVEVWDRFLDRDRLHPATMGARLP
ncbi:MAG: YjbH domain-containing protein [Gemmatimonadota bacterium]|nr:YjbH domain-containing protein [Gemmatimonadota bacterium]